MRTFLVIILLVYTLSSVHGQENAGTNVAPALQQCYNETRYATRDYRPPATINVLVDIIRRIEDGNPSQDAREISYQLLHRFRQDGIRRTTKDIDISQGLPYSPKGWESYKNRVQLMKITPGNAVTFNNQSVSPMQACALHFMVSSTIEVFVRGDEMNCPQTIARYTNRIHKRQIELSDSSRSSCPIESGVVYTKWGAVKAGLVLAGIAAGFQSNPIRIGNYTLKSEYASTIAGELSETALNQVSSTKTIGSKGGWNSTVAPKYYFLETNDRDSLYLTDAEIRGGLDGLFLALNVQNWKSKANNIKISQMLDLYYSRGVFNDSSRACNRKTLFNNLVSDDVLIQQTTAFSKLLDGESQLSYTPKEENLPTMAKAAVDGLKNYLSGNLIDLACSADTDLVERVSTDVLIFIDAAWNYEIIQPLVSYFLENIDVNKYESSYTIFDGANCDIIVNKSTSILDYYEQYNLTRHDKYPTSGFDYSKVVQMAERVFKAKLDNETDLTGQSMIILMLPHTTPSTTHRDYVRTRREDFKSTLPDVKILVGGSGTQSSYNDLVSNTNSDIFTITEDTSESQIKDTSKRIVERLKKLPRSVVNPSCKSSFSSDGSGNFEITQYVEPSAINYHKISPNYFYDGESLKIRGQGFGTITACTSRTDANPKTNATGTTCKTIANSDEMSVDISSYCTDESVTSCSPIYISVQGEESSSPRCTEKLCRFPDNIKYTIYLERVQCSSSSIKIISSILLVFLLLVVGKF